MRLRDLGKKKVAELPEGAVAKRVIFGGLFFALDTGTAQSNQLRDVLFIPPLFN